MNSKNTIVRNAVFNDIPEVLLLLHAPGYIINDTSEFRNMWNEITADQKMGIVVAVTGDAISGYLAYF